MVLRSSVDGSVCIHRLPCGSNFRFSVRMRRYDLRDFEWRAIEALLQPHTLHTSTQLILTRPCAGATGTHPLPLKADHRLDVRERLSCLFAKADERAGKVWNLTRDCLDPGRTSSIPRPRRKAVNASTIHCERSIALPSSTSDNSERSPCGTPQRCRLYRVAAPRTRTAVTG